MTTIYQVKALVKKDSLLPYLDWLRKGHITQVLACPGFLSATLWTGDAHEDGWAPVLIHYEVLDRESLDLYKKDHAPTLRQDGVQRFGENFRTEREVWNSVENYVRLP